MLLADAKYSQIQTKAASAIRSNVISVCGSRGTGDLDSSLHRGSGLNRGRSDIADWTCRSGLNRPSRVFSQSELFTI
jgi:hypothetical protein